MLEANSRVFRAVDDCLIGHNLRPAWRLARLFILLLAMVSLQSVWRSSFAAAAAAVPTRSLYVSARAPLASQASNDCDHYAQHRNNSISGSINSPLSHAYIVAGRQATGLHANMHTNTDRRAKAKNDENRQRRRTQTSSTGHQANRQ